MGKGGPMVAYFRNFQTRKIIVGLLLGGIFGISSLLSGASFPEAETGQEAEQKKVYALPEGAEMSEVRELIFLTESLSGEETGKKEFLLRVNGTPEFHAGFTSALKIARDGNPRETQTEPTPSVFIEEMYPVSGAITLRLYLALGKSSVFRI